MALDNNQFDGHGDIAQFLEKFKEQTFSPANAPFQPSDFAPRENSLPAKSVQYEKSLEKLEQKIQELEDKFEATAGQNQMILSELARTREAMERQKDKDAFLEHISRTTSNLKASVENLSRSQQNTSSFSYRAPDVQRSFDTEPHFPKAADEAHTAIYHYQPDNYRAAQAEKMRREYEEKERIISSLHQKASQLKAVNSALDREIRKVQQEKMEALKKSAEQAKEILSLRDQLTAAEERFKSFDFENRIISIKQQYQQKVTSLENQLQEISDTCMRQVEEIESLRAENIKLHKAAEEKEQALARLEAKERELETLKAEMAALRENHSQTSKKQLTVFSERLRVLEGQRDELSTQFQSAQSALEAVRQEKEMLEKNFKELVEKINQNDVVIGQLKQKIEVLGQQNEELSHQNATLQDAKQNLEQNLSAANLRAEELTREKDTLSARTDELSREREFFDMQSESWSQEREEWRSSNEQLKQEKAELQNANRALTEQKDNLETRLVELDREKAELVARTEELGKEKQQLSLRAGALTQEKASLLARVEELIREKETVVAQVKSWETQHGTMQGSQNQLVQEKEELNKRVAELEQEKAQLVTRTQELDRENAELAARTQEISQEKEALSARVEALSQEKTALSAQVEQARQTLARQAQELSGAKENLQHDLQIAFREREELSREKESLLEQTESLKAEKEALAAKSQKLEEQARELAGEKQTLAKENQQLRNQSAALLAARLVQEKERAEKQEFSQQKNAPAQEPAKPAAMQKPAVVQAWTDQPVPQEPAAPKIVEKKVSHKTEEVPLSEQPVAMSKQAPAKVQTEADLPEIKVADPVPQTESLFNGEDFLEKTDSFIGRMKWSIFREDR